MKKEFFDSCVAERQEGAPLMLAYSIVCDAEGYGAEITVQCGGEHDEACVTGITTSRQKIVRLMHRLRDNQVTPCTLKDVVCDLLGEL